MLHHHVPSNKIIGSLPQSPPTHRFSLVSLHELRPQSRNCSFKLALLFFVFDSQISDGPVIMRLQGCLEGTVTLRGELLAGRIVLAAQQSSNMIYAVDWIS